MTRRIIGELLAWSALLILATVAGRWTVSRRRQPPRPKGDPA
jgi:hypothetical protein